MESTGVKESREDDCVNERFDGRDVDLLLIPFNMDCNMRRILIHNPYCAVTYDMEYDQEQEVAQK